MARSTAKSAEALLWKMAESDEVQIETLRNEKSRGHAVTIWIVPVKDGVYIRSYKAKRGRWYQEALANTLVTIRLGRERVKARVEPEKNAKILEEVSDAYKAKYGERWPEETEPMLSPPVIATTLRLQGVQE